MDETKNVPAKSCPVSCDKKIILGIIIIILAIGYGAYAKRETLQKFFTKNIGQEEAKTKAEKFIKENMVQPGTEVTIKEVADAGAVYKIALKVGSQDIVAYMTKDGTKLFPQGIDMVSAEKQNKDGNEQNAPKDIPKTDKPVVDLYVMSFCPYGNKAENTLEPVYDLLKDKADFNFYYIVNTSDNGVESLHGAKEVAENEKEACVLKYYGKDKWFAITTYVNDNCGSDGSCWDAGAKESGIDAAKISTCLASEGVELMKVNESFSTAANAKGSPTLTINGVKTSEVYKYGDSEAYKQAICGAFNDVPAECSKTLSSSTSTAQGGSCN